MPDLTGWKPVPPKMHTHICHSSPTQATIVKARIAHFDETQTAA
jgi:hypothetical protein